MRRLSPGTLLVGIFAILFGLLTAYAVKRALTQTPAEVVTEKPKEMEWRIPVAVGDLPVGRTITDNDVMTLTLNREQLAKADFPPMWMNSVPQIVGRTLRQPHKNGQPFNPSLFYPTGMAPDVSEKLKPGERAVTISMQPEAVDGMFVTPGSVIDVLFRAKSDDKLELPDATVTLLSQVRVLAVGTNTVEGERSPAEPGKKQTVTLALNDKQARALKVVEERGSLTLTLRNASDATPAEKDGPTTILNLLGLKEPEEPFVSEMYRRGQLRTLTFRGGRREKLELEAPYGLPVSGDTQSPNGAGNEPTPGNATPPNGGNVSPPPPANPLPPNPPAASYPYRRPARLVVGR